MNWNGGMMSIPGLPDVALFRPARDTLNSCELAHPGRSDPDFVLITRHYNFNACFIFSLTT